MIVLWFERGCVECPSEKFLIFATFVPFCLQIATLGKTLATQRPCFATPGILQKLHRRFTGNFWGISRQLFPVARPPTNNERTVYFSRGGAEICNKRMVFAFLIIDTVQFEFPALAWLAGILKICTVDRRGVLVLIVRVWSVWCGRWSVDGVFFFEICLISCSN